MWQYCRDIPTVNNNSNIIEFNGANVTDSFNSKAKITGQTGDNGAKIVEIMLPLKYLIIFCRTVEMSLINCEIDLILTWSANCVIVYTNDVNHSATFAITETKLYVLVVTL